MGVIQEPKKVKLISSIISNTKNYFDNVEKNLITNFGTIDFKSQILPFNHTKYYNKEMGHTLVRKFVSFEKLILPDELAEIKIKANEIEQEFLSENNNRNLNIDPGYITLAKLVLASTKDYSHRIYLKKGIFAEATLHFYKGNFESFPFTYPDYGSDLIKNILVNIRGIYKEQLADKKL